MCGGKGAAWHERGNGCGDERGSVSAIVSLSLAAAGGGGEHTSSRDSALKVQGTQIHPWTLPTTAAIKLAAFYSCTDFLALKSRYSNLEFALS